MSESVRSLPRDDPDAVRRQLIDATEACFRRFGVAKTTMEDIASTAGVSRATVYRYVSGRDELILGVLLRAGDEFYARVVRADTFADALIDGVLYTLDQVRADDRLTLLFAPEAAGETVTIAGAADALFQRSANYLRPLVVEAQANGELRRDINADDLGEWMIRVILSFLTVRGPKTAPDHSFGACWSSTCCRPCPDRCGSSKLGRCSSWGTSVEDARRLRGRRQRLRARRDGPRSRRCPT